MTGPEDPHTPALPVQGPTTAVAVAAGHDYETAWCTDCKAYTRITGVTVVLTPCGISTVGTWSWCEICEDPCDTSRRPLYAR